MISQSDIFTEIVACGTIDVKNQGPWRVPCLALDYFNVQRQRGAVNLIQL